MSGSRSTIAFISDPGTVSELEPSTRNTVEALDQASALGINAITVREWLNLRVPQKGADLDDYCRLILNRRMIPTGRVQVIEKGACENSDAIRLARPDRRALSSDRPKIVLTDQLPTSTHRPFISCFSTAPGIKVIQSFAHLSEHYLQSSAIENFCILGAGWKGIEAAIALLDAGLPHDKICWVKSREPWVLAAPAPSATPPHSQLATTSLQANLTAMAHAQTQDDLCFRLEEAGMLMRLSEHQAPSYFLPHVVSRKDAHRLRAIARVIRKGHVHAISKIGMVLTRGIAPMPDKTLYIDCTGRGDASRAPNLVFQPGKINLAEIRLCHPSFSAAMIGAIACSNQSDAELNKMCVPISGKGIADRLLTSILNHHAWLRSPDLRRWLEKSRLDPLLQRTAWRLNHSDRTPQDLKPIRSILPRVIINLESMIQRDQDMNLQVS
ncbi:MAG: hypothetical protein AAF437_00930 [Pseudomonadota bacterium]